MQNSEHKIDELFRSKLNNFEVTPPPAVWDNIAVSMGISRRKRRAIIIWSMSGAASLLLAFLMGWYLSTNQNNSEELMAEITELENHNIEQFSPSSDLDQNIKIQPNKTEIAQQKTPAILAFSSAKALKDESKLGQTEQTFLNRTLASSTSKTSDAGKKLADTNLTLLNSKQASVPTIKTSFPSLISQAKIGFLSQADRAIMEQNLMAMQTESQDQSKSGWAIGVQASPLFRFDQLQLGNADFAEQSAAVQNQTSTSYQANVSGSIALEYNAGSKFSFIGGIGYTEVAQNSGDIAMAYTGHNWLNNRYSFDKAFASDQESLVTSNPQNKIVLNTQVGLANIVIPEGMVMASAKTANSLSPDVAQNYEFKQQARYVEIPMLVRYKILDNVVGLHVTGGINTNVLVDNNARLENQNEILASGQIEGLRPLTLSSSLGMGMNYDLTDHLNLSIEPMLKIQLNSLNQQQYFNSRPYGFGVFSGITYQF